MDINKIREITKINDEKNQEDHKMFLEWTQLKEAKEAEKIIIKLNKCIKKAAKKGKYEALYEVKKPLTNDQGFIIKHYFTDKGYSIRFENFYFYHQIVNVFITISWREK